MFKSNTKKYADESDEKTFRFVFYCDLCGKEFRPEVIRFGGADADDKDVLWKVEHAKAFARADYAAKYHFFRCPVCGEYVCGDCAENIWEDGEVARSVCKRCLGRMKARAAPGLRIMLDERMMSASPKQETEVKLMTKPMSRIKKGWWDSWRKKPASQV